MTAMAGAAFTGLTGYMGMAGNKNRPLVLQIEDGEVLVCRESMGVFLNEEGRPTRRDGIDWTVVPEEVLYVKPYVLSILPPSAGRQLPANPLLQVRSASTLVAVQTLPFPPGTEISTFSIKSGNYPSVRHLTSSTGNKPPLYVKVTPTERGPLARDRSQWLEMFGAKKKKAKGSESSATDHGADTSDNMSIRSGKSFATGLNIPREQSRLRGLWGRRPQSIVGEPEGFTPGTSPAKGASLKGSATTTSASPLAIAATNEMKEAKSQQISTEESPEKQDIPALPAQPKAMPLPSEDERKAIDALGSFLADRRRILNQF
ncbi:hypothetical protein L7F22_019462 [Adiantum nelumboides]|nr:hypothetical protein [Adiantum nelumboides]